MKIMKLVFSLADRRDEARRLEDLKMLRDRLPGQRDLMLHGQSRTQLEQGLAVSLNQFVQDRAACRSCDRLKDIAHTQT